ncbi:MAG: FIST signal transduction protein [Lysobacterales bacterium]
MYVDSSTIRGVLDGLEAIPRPANSTLMVMLANHPDLSVKDLAQGLHERQIPAFGASFPALVAHSAFHFQGAIGIPVVLSQPPVLVDDETIHTGVEGCADVNQTCNGPQTLVMFYATPEFDINHLIQKTYDHWGPTVNYVGAGAGSTQFTSGQWVFNGAETTSNGAVLAMLDSDSSMNLKHGWKPIAGPLVASRCEENRICDLNWQTAYDVYRDALPRSLNIADPQDLIHRIARTYPLAIAPTDDGEPVIRTPFGVDDNGALLMVCGVPENSTLYVAHGEPEDLMGQAQGLAAPLRDVTNPSNHQLLITCIARHKVLGADQFRRELELIQSGSSQPVFGVASLGEIASDGARYFDVHNKAMALVQLHA